MEIRILTANIIMTQNIQRQETPACTIKPAMIGPSTGPTETVVENKLIARPRVIGSHTSAMRPPAFDKGAQANTPQKKRVMMSVWIF